MSDATWVILPFVNGRDMLMAAIADVLGQSVPTRILVIGQGCDSDLRRELERVSEDDPTRVFCWFFSPALPSLAQVWNDALSFAWTTGGTEALVVNSDVRLHRRTLEVLRLYMTDEKALFVSAVGVTAEQFNPDEPTGIPSQLDGSRLTSRGGPDFSCFLISKECHDKYRFDQGHIPAYGEDCSYHRSMMLGGDGHRIFSINLPYLHYASGTLKTMDPDRRQQIESQINNISRKYYEWCWGGPVNHERFTIKGDPASAQDGVTNPDLQRAILHPAEA